MEKKNLAELRSKVLENKTIKVKPIIRRKAYLKPGHDGEHTYTGCHKVHGLPFDTKKRSYRNPFRDQDEQEAFEVLLNQKEGSLNLYEFKVNEPNFWGSFSIRIPKDGIELDLRNPSDALMYRVLSVNSKFAKNKQESGVAEKEYLIINEMEEKEQESALGKKKDEANDFMYKLKKSKVQMLNTLKLLGKKPDKDASAEWLRSELYKVIDEVTVNKGISGLDKFLEVMKDPIADTKLLVLNAIEKGEIKRDSIGYKVIDSNLFVGRNYEEVVQYFLDSNPKVQELKAIIEDRINK
jgi:hypothetical protein